MSFKRNWDSSCPRVWQTWEANGQQWVLQDLDPADDEEALTILLDHLCTDEALCAASDLVHDEKSMIGMRKFWEECLPQRMSLAIYTWVGGKKTLVALNVCVVVSAGETIPDVESSLQKSNNLKQMKIEGEKWKNVFAGLEYVETKTDPHKYLEMDTLLHAYGLVVRREYRGAKLGGRLLAAREYLCKAYGIRGTTTVFTGPASQKLAEKCGFTTISVATFKELAESGLDYPSDINRRIKLMVKKFD